MCILSFARVWLRLFALSTPTAGSGRSSFRLRSLILFLKQGWQILYLAFEMDLALKYQPRPRQRVEQTQRSTWHEGWAHNTVKERIFVYQIITHSSSELQAPTNDLRSKPINTRNFNATPWVASISTDNYSSLGPLVITYQEIAYYPPGPVLIDEKNDGPRLGLRGEHVDDGIELRLLGRSLDLEMNRFKGVSSIVLKRL